MQEVDDKKLSDLSKRFLQAISYCGLSGYKLKKDNIISSESTLTSIKKGIQSEKDIRDALKNARMQSDSTISKVAPYLQDILVKVKYVPIDAAASLREFDRIIYFSDLTKANITLYDDWLHAKGYSQPTIYNYHKRNKRYIHEAIKFDLLKNDPYKGVKMENVSKMLGHTNVRTTQQYAKVLNAEVEKDFEMLERILS